MNNKFFLIVSALLVFIGCAFAQKPALDVAVVKHWEQLSNVMLGPNKKQLVYQITDSTVVIKTLASNVNDTVLIPQYKTQLSFAFDPAGEHLIFCSLVFRAKPGRPKTDGVAVDLWSWDDSVLKSQELYELSAPDSLILNSYFSVANKSIVKTDTSAWSWTSWRNHYPFITVKPKFRKRLRAHFPVTDSVRIIGQLNNKQFIIERSSLAKPPELLLTTRFRKYDAFIDIQLYQNYNWYTAEITNLAAPPGAINKAILYKPEDFDATQKYPVILCISDPQPQGAASIAEAYQALGLNDSSNAPVLYNGNITGRSHTGLYAPVLSNGILNIPYFVSRGFIVLEMPATIVTGGPGPAMCDRVMGAISTLSQHGWADTSRLGIHGQGTSGYYVNYIITQTAVFKAAHQSTGQTDLISHYGSIDGKGRSMQPYYDAPKGFFGKTLWEDQAAYIWQSPVILANRIQTPLLMMHSKEDIIMPFAQSIELFTGMRRLGNRCWLLQYDNEQHTLTDKQNQEDFTIRLEQFYNHYLKNAGAPIWMTRGVSAADKGIIPDLEIDTEIKTPPVGGLLRKDADK